MELGYLNGYICPVKCSCCGHETLWEDLEVDDEGEETCPMCGGKEFELL